MIHDALFTILSTNVGVSGLVSSRIRPAPKDDDTAPFIVYEQLSAARPSAMGSDIGIVESRFGVKAFAGTFTQAAAVGAAVRSALTRYRGTVSGTEILDIFFENESLGIYDDDAELHQVVNDFRVIYRE